MSSLFYLNKYLIKYKRRLILGTIFLFVSNFFSVEQPELVGNTINDIIAEFGSENNNKMDSALKLGLLAAGFYMLLSILKGLFLFFTRQTIIVMSRFIEYDLKNEIYAQYQRLSFNFYKKNATGDLMNRISEDVSKVRMYLGPGIMYTINIFFLFTLILIKMISRNAELTLYVLLPLPIMSVLIYFVSRVLNKKSEKVQYQQSFLSTIVQESFAGIRVVKSHVKEKTIEDKFEAEAEGFKQRSMSLAKTNAFFMPTIILLIGVSTILTIYIGGLQTNNGEIDPGEIAEFIFYVNMLTWPFASVGWVTSIVQHAAASQKRINEFLNVEPEVTSENGAIVRLKESMVFKDIHMIYENSGVQALEGVNFSLKKGETLGIIGKTGSGKSSLAYLIMRLLDPTKGEILIDGNRLSDIDLTTWRETIGYVPQEHFLFSDSIKNNIIFGANTTDVSDEVVFEAARNAGIHDTIMGFPEKYDTLLGERGINLSGGQKQRLSIARALIKNPEVLVLDDCLSAVDNETEEYILKSIKDDLNEKTAIIISHRISSIKYADKIIVFHEGRLLEEGSHDELLALKGHYYATYKRQEIQSQEEREGNS